jgi:hypothetical protein
VEQFDSATSHPAILGSFSRQRPLLHFALLNLGNQKFSPRETKIDDPQKMGYLGCLQNGLMDMILGLNNFNTARWAQATYGMDTIIRITGDIDPTFDDVSPAFQERVAQEAERVWMQDIGLLEQFFFR